MRPSLAAALTLVTLAAVRPVSAGAQSCSEESVSKSHLVARCGAPGAAAGCNAFVASVIKNCEKDFDRQIQTLTELNKAPEPDKEKLDAARHEILLILDLQQTLSANISGGTHPREGEVTLPALDYEKFENAYLGSIESFSEKIKSSAPKQPGQGDAAESESSAGKSSGTNKLNATEDLLSGVAENVEHFPASTKEGALDNKASAGETYMAAGNVKEVKRLGAELAKLAPKSSSGPSLLARAALSESKPEAAADWARQALALNPADTEAKHALAFAEASLSKSRLRGPGSKPGFADSSDPGAAGEGAEGTVGAGGARFVRYGTAPPPGVQVTQAPPEEILPVPPHLEQARHMASTGDLAGALGALTLALDQNPDDDVARIMRAEISLALDNPDAALADADRFLTKHPDDPRALRAKASALLQLGRLEEALAVIERAVALAPLNAAGRLTRAMILEKLGRSADAAAEYLEAARLDPSLKPVAQEALRRLGFSSDGKPLSPLQKPLVRYGLVALAAGLMLAYILGRSSKQDLARVAEKPSASQGRTRETSTGDLVGGQYRVARELGRGGMGVVFEAIDETLKRSVALKQMHADLLTAEDAARFLQEARLVAQLKHPNIATILAAVEDGGLFLVFELVEGRPLDKVLAQGGTMPPSAVRRVIDDLCDALDCAHRQRIIHRDLKPSNVMLSADGRSKIMDFGIAHQSRGAAATQTSASGTPPYMAPEQAMGSVLPASDLYALGVMTYELLAGTRPFRGPDFLGPKMRGEFEPISRLRPSLPASLDAFFSAALAPDPQRRPKDAAGFRKAFNACWDEGLARTVV